MSNLDPSGMVHSVADAMKNNPTCLAAVLLSAMFALLTYLSLAGERSEMHERQLKLIERCVPPQGDGDDVGMLDAGWNRLPPGVTKL
jgi:hypothetical protein